MQLLETVCVDWPYWPRGAISNAKAVLNVDAMREKNMEVADLSTPDKKKGKSRSRSSRCCGLSSIEYHGWKGKKRGHSNWRKLLWRSASLTGKVCK